MRGTITQSARGYDLHVGDITLAGMAIDSEWEGFTKFTSEQGDIIVHLDTPSALGGITLRDQNGKTGADRFTLLRASWSLQTLLYKKENNHA